MFQMASGLGRNGNLREVAAQQNNCVSAFIRETASGNKGASHVPLIANELAPTGWSRRLKRRCLTRQQRVQLASLLQQGHVVETADVALADEDLRHGATTAALHHDGALFH